MQLVSDLTLSHSIYQIKVHHFEYFLRLAENISFEKDVMRSSHNAYGFYDSSIFTLSMLCSFTCLFPETSLVTIQVTHLGTVLSDRLQLLLLVSILHRSFYSPL